MAAKDPDVLTPTEAGRMLGIGKTKTCELVAAGEFPVPMFRMGARWKVSRKLVVAFRDGGQPESGAA